MENQTKPQKSFTFNPDVVGTAPDGRSYFVERNPYTIYSALGTGDLYYTIKDAKFWSGENKEIDPAIFETQFLPRLRWKFDQFVEQDQFKETEVEIEDSKGQKKIERRKELIGKEVVNKFPCTTKNILKKRTELMAAAVQSGVDIDLNKIQIETSPTELLSPEEVRQALKPAGFFGDTYQLIKRLMRS